MYFGASLHENVVPFYKTLITEGQISQNFPEYTLLR
jgi:hypothetical protein